MPELPEVELHRRHLERWLVDHTVMSATVQPARLRPPASAGALGEALTGSRPGVPVRAGKHVAVPVSGPRPGALYVHLGMTGRWTRRRRGEAEPRFRVLSLTLSDGHVVDLTDARRFSCLGWLESGEAVDLGAALGLGPDLLTQVPFPAGLLGRLAGRRRGIKEVLMDQAVVAGLGNIHAAEALWRARIHPSLPARDLDLPGARALLRAIQATFRVVLDDDDGEGVAYVEEGAPNPFKVYGRAGRPCPRCHGPVARYSQGGRSTYLCPACQPAPTTTVTSQGRP
jgi:formamidopyrimidine-DNA glycosylase